jgi:hypothetical protein
VKHASILVVDDEPGIRVQLEAILRDEGFGVTSVSRGEEALAAVSRELYDLIMLDVWLPGMDGIDTLRQLRAAGHQAPVHSALCRVVYDPFPPKAVVGLPFTAGMGGARITSLDARSRAFSASRL